MNWLILLEDKISELHAFECYPISLLILQINYQLVIKIYIVTKKIKYLIGHMISLDIL